MLPVTVSKTAAGSAAAQDGKPAVKTTAKHHIASLFAICTSVIELNGLQRKVVFHHKELQNHVKLFSLSENVRLPVIEDMPCVHASRAGIGHRANSPDVVIGAGLATLERTRP